MLKIPINEIVEKITSKTGLSNEVILKKIEEKVTELSGLVSKDGAAHIVANEFGVQLFKTSESGLMLVKDIKPGLKSVSFVARVLRIYPTKEFKTPKREGKVASFSVADETGQMRVVFWDTNFIDMLENSAIKEGDVVKITNCYVKESQMGGVEVHASNRTKIDVNPKDVKAIPELTKPKIDRKKIKDLGEGEAELRGAVVYLFETGKPFFEVCPTCNKKSVEGICQTHNKIIPKQSLIVSAIIDDGTGNIRVVFFGNRAEQLLKISSDDAFKLAKEHNDDFYAIKTKRTELLGKEIICEGRVSTNSFSGDIEMICNQISEPNPLSESKRLLTWK